MSSQVTRSTGLRTARVGSPDPLAPLNVEAGAPPVSDAALNTTFGDARSEAHDLTGRGEHGGRAMQDHEARPGNSAGRLQFPSSKRDAALAALAALESEL
mgnify:CR=1 FL=1